MKREVREDQHGTPTGYVYGCRCSDCRNAAKAYRASTRLKGLPDDDPRHGTPTGYVHHGCRCEDCIQANSEHTGARRQELRPEADGPTAGLLREWGKSLGLPVGLSPAPWLIERWNREHPDRPYLGKTPKPNPFQYRGVL